MNERRTRSPLSCTRPSGGRSQIVEGVDCKQNFSYTGGATCSRTDRDGYIYICKICCYYVNF